MYRPECKNTSKPPCKCGNRNGQGQSSIPVIDKTYIERVIEQYFLNNNMHAMTERYIRSLFAGSGDVSALVTGSGVTVVRKSESDVKLSDSSYIEVNGKHYVYVGYLQTANGMAHVWGNGVYDGMYWSGDYTTDVENPWSHDALYNGTHGKESQYRVSGGSMERSATLYAWSDSAGELWYSYDLSGKSGASVISGRVVRMAELADDTWRFWTLEQNSGDADVIKSSETWGEWKEQIALDDDVKIYLSDRGLALYNDLLDDGETASEAEIRGLFEN